MLGRSCSTIVDTAIYVRIKPASVLGRSDDAQQPELHLIARERASFVAEDVLHLQRGSAKRR